MNTTNTIKRLWKNLKWFVNHPPTYVTNTQDYLTCDYCGNDTPCWMFTDANDHDVFTICFYCMRRIADKVLTQPTKTKPK